MHQYNEHDFPEKRGPNRERKKHLELIHRVRVEETAKSREFMGPMMSIPPLDWSVLKVRFPELISLDPQIQKHAWDTFAAHAASEPYRTQFRKRV